MSSQYYRIDEHILECQHIRGYPRSTAHSQEEVLHFAIKQYTPRDNLSPKPGDVTIIGAHANAFPKELYEPLWDELHHRSKSAGFRIRGIWIADVAFQGASSVLNETKLGNDPSWYDHPRDLLHMVNTFRDQMPRPIIGIGHSMGGNNLVNLSLMHPRLLETLVLIDPVVQSRASAQGNFAPPQASARRRDLWPSRRAARETFLKSKFYQTWDRRVLDCWIQHGLRDLPTQLYPLSAAPKATPTASSTSSTPSTISPGDSSTTPAFPDPPVTLTTTKHQEVLSFLRPNPPLALIQPSKDQPHIAARPRSRHTHPDIHPAANPETPFYRPEPIITFHNLPFLRPSVLYVFGDLSALSAPDFRKEKMDITGTGVGGSGGAKEGRVKEVLLKGVGHLIPMERVGETAEKTAEWVEREMRDWRAREEEDWNEWRKVPVEERSKLSEAFLEKLAMGIPELPPVGKKGPKPKL